MKGKPVDEISHNFSENSKEFNESPTQKTHNPKKKYLENNNKDKRILKFQFNLSPLEILNLFLCVFLFSGKRFLLENPPDMKPLCDQLAEDTKHPVDRAYSSSSSHAAVTPQEKLPGNNYCCCSC